MLQLLGVTVVMVAGAISAVAIGGLMEIVRALLDTERRHAMHRRTFRQNFRRMMS